MSNRHTAGMRSGPYTTTRMIQKSKNTRTWEVSCDCGSVRNLTANAFVKAKNNISCSCSRTPNGDLMRWLLDHVNHQGDDCLIWPYGRSRGYAQMNLNGRPKKACMVMCELAHGKPTQMKPVSRHTCGKGDKGCINPRHLEWGTQAENVRDRARDNTDNKGTRNGMSRLTEENVRAIRDLCQTTTLFHREIGAMFGISRQNVDDIANRERWGWLS